MLNGRIEPYLAAGVISINLLLSFSRTYAEDENSEKQSVVEKVTEAVSVKEAYAMPVPAPVPPAAIIPQYGIKSFIKYINQPAESRFSKEKPTREDFEKVPIYRAYYAIDDKKEKIEEKIARPINESKWKEAAGIDKISTKFNDEYLKLQVKLKEKQERPKSILGKLLRLTIGSVDKIIGKADYDSSMVELKAVNEF